jgi:hypothetical protein
VVDVSQDAVDGSLCGGDGAVVGRIVDQQVRRGAERLPAFCDDHHEPPVVTAALPLFPEVAAGADDWLLLLAVGAAVAAGTLVELELSVDVITGPVLLLAVIPEDVFPAYDAAAA